MTMITAPVHHNVQNFILNFGEVFQKVKKLKLPYFV